MPITGQDLATALILLAALIAGVLTAFIQDRLDR